MRFDLFENMTPEEAKAILDKFLSEQPAYCESLCVQASEAGVSCDLSVESIPEFIRFVMGIVTTRQIQPDENVPEWIRSTDDYQNSLYEFDEHSGDLIVTAAYYVGECFRKSFTSLNWGVGDVETAFGNMPVVQGFEDNRELPPMVVLENLIRRIIEAPGKDGDIENMVKRWASMVEESRC